MAGIINELTKINVTARSINELININVTAGSQINMICHHDEVANFDSIVVTQNDRPLFSILSIFKSYNSKSGYV